jgi:hypothetical protein
MKIAMKLIVLGIAGLSSWLVAGARADDAHGRPMRMLQDLQTTVRPAAAEESADKAVARPLPAESSAFADAKGGPAAAMLADEYRPAPEGPAEDSAAGGAPGPRAMPSEAKPDKPKKRR